MADYDLDALEFHEVLAGVAAQTTCEPGKAATLSLAPLASVAQADAEQALVEDATAYVHAGGALAFEGAVDVREHVARAELGAPLSSLDLRAIAHAEASLARVAARSSERALVAVESRARQDVAVEFIRPSNASGHLQRLFAQRADTNSVVRSIENAIEPDGRVADNASAELRQIRQQQRILHEDIRKRCQAIVRSPKTAKMLSEPLVTIRAGRYVVPVRKEFAGSFNGVVHDESASGATVYIEPMACVEPNNRLRALEAAEEREIAKILGRLTADVASRAADLKANAELLTRLDTLGARARWALSRGAQRPKLNADRALRIVGGRHPLLTRAVTPCDVELGQRFNALVISGPNMGGKSVALKTIGLFCVLAYAGIPLPAQAGTEIGWFDRIACVLGDEQSIARNLSSFSAHLEALRQALAGAKDGNLLLVDEIGGGTEPVAGAALAQAFIEAALEAGARVVVTTHYTQLKVFAAETATITNASMLFDEATNAPTYVLALGVPGQSLALPLAKALRLPPAMIARAEALLGDENRRLDAAFSGLAAERFELRRQQADLDEQRAQTERLAAQLRDKTAALEAERRQFEHRAAAVLDDAARQVRADLMERAASGEASRRRQASARASAAPDLAKTLTDVRKRLGLEAAAPGETIGPELRAGDRVLVSSFNAAGVVSELYARDALVAIGGVKVVVPRSDLTADRTERKLDIKAGRINSTATEPVAALTEIDVRGMRVDEAMPLVDKALDSAALAGAQQLRIIHGKGTGQLGRGLRSFLKDHAQVEGFASAGEREGGSGVTVVTLR